MGMARMRVNFGGTGERVPGARRCGLLVHSELSVGAVLCTGHVRPVTREAVMKANELDVALSLITKVFCDPSVDSDQKDQLRRAKRELEKAAQCGKSREDRISRAVELVAKVLLEIVKRKRGQ